VKDKDEQEDLIERLITGELDLESPEVQEALSDPSFRAEYESAANTMAWLDAAGSHARELARQAEDEGPVDGEDAVHQVFAREARAQTPPAPKRSWAPIWLAAAAVIVAGWLFFGLEPSSDPAPDPSRILGASIAELEPSGATDVFGEFRWRYDLPPGGWFLVTIDSGVDGGEILTSEKLFLPSWRPSVEAWPAVVRWEVQAFDESGRRIASATAEAARP